MRKGTASKQERAVPTSLSMRPSETKKWKTKAHQLNKTFSELVRLALETLLLEPRSKSSFNPEAYTMWFKGLDDARK